LLILIYIPTVSIIDARKALESPIVQTLNKRIEQDFMTNEPNKLAFDHLFSGSMFQMQIQ